MRSSQRTPDHGQSKFTFPIWLSETPSGRHGLFFAGHPSPWTKIFRCPSGSSKQNAGNSINNSHTAPLMTLGNLKNVAHSHTPEIKHRLEGTIPFFPRHSPPWMKIFRFPTGSKSTAVETSTPPHSYSPENSKKLKFNQNFQNLIIHISYISNPNSPCQFILSKFKIINYHLRRLSLHAHYISVITNIS